MLATLLLFAVLSSDQPAVTNISPYTSCENRIDTPKAISFLHVDELPEYPGGSQALQTFIDKNLSWPQADICFEGRLIVSFVIEENGRPSNVKITNFQLDPFEREVRKMFNRMPRWTPGRNNKKTVRTLLYIPIDYRIRE
ncbi:protein TonB [Chitinophaga sp. YR627]|uniref:energy transducer TonB n=1 Tax=Chitinophaga sp. YR627 TaxID=1881041 RepID=UPI0008EE1176|nr:energy transducer TonB [Chitinophaga sp. YR627]SFM98819.1 protein TonB [Chitinophaga sp. YR627]